MSQKENLWKKISGPSSGKPTVASVV